MGLSIDIDNVTELATGIWQGELATDEAQLLRRTSNVIGPNAIGPRTVLLAENPHYSAVGHCLKLELLRCFPINIGTGRETIIIDATSVASKPGLNGVSFGAGDNQFLHAIDTLPDPLRAVGRDLLAKIRQKRHGDLQFAQTTGRFVERPDNYFTIKPQPRAGSYVITVRGNPHEFGTTAIQLKQDRGSYSRFNICQLTEVDNAVAVIIAAKRRNPIAAAEKQAAKPKAPPKTLAEMFGLD